MTTDAAPASPSPAALAEALAACPELWADLVEHAPDHRVHDRLAAGDGWEAYLITWPSGHGVELHDHGGSAGAVAVVEGHLVELVGRRAGPGGTGRVTRVPLPAGTVRRVSTSRVHDVVNAAAAPATSIHVYAPPLTAMTFYDDDMQAVRTERVFPEAPLGDEATVATALAALAPSSSRSTAPR